MTRPVGSPDRPMHIGRYQVQKTTLRDEPAGIHHPMLAVSLRALPADASPLPSAWQEFHFVMERDDARRFARTLLDLTGG